MFIALKFTDVHLLEVKRKKQLFFAANLPFDRDSKRQLYLLCPRNPKVAGYRQSVDRVYVQERNGESVGGKEGVAVGRDVTG